MNSDFESLGHTAVPSQVSDCKYKMHQKESGSKQNKIVPNKVNKDVYKIYHSEDVSSPCETKKL